MRDRHTIATERLIPSYHQLSLALAGASLSATTVYSYHQAFPGCTKKVQDIKTFHVISNFKKIETRKKERWDAIFFRVKKGSYRGK
jgi:hypothetical protein